MKVVLSALTVFALALIAQAAWQHFNPPFTDAQFATEGIVDTWEPHAIVTGFLLLALAIFALGVAAVLAFSRPALRRRSTLALVALVVAGASQLVSHVELTHKVTRATGQTFGGFYGLF